METRVSFSFSYSDKECGQLSSRSVGATLGGSNVSQPIRREIEQSRVHIDQCVSAIRAVGAPLFLCLLSSCIHVIELVGRKGPHTRTSLARESGWARVPMSQTRPCVECHEPDLADSVLARQGLRWGSALRRLAIGSYVCGRSQARLAYPHGHKHKQCEFCH